MTSHIVAHRRRVNATTVASTGERRHELDWLRVLVIVGLIPFHVLGLFAIAMTNYLTDGQPNQLAVLVSNFFILWPMSLLFLVAGASTWFALGRRTPRQYTRERILRLFIPFLFATLVLIPIQVFAVVRAYPQIIDLNLIPSAGLRGDESFLEFYPPYLAGYAHFLTHFSSMGETVFWGHIWFVPRLLLYALATLPLLLWLRSTPGMRLIDRIADMFVVPGTTLLLGVAIALPRILAALAYRTAIQITGKANWDIFNQWAQLGVFMMCFVLGYIFYASPRLLHAVRRDGTVALALGIVSFALLQTPLGHFASVTEATPSGILISWLRAESEWLLVAGVLSVGLNFFNFANGLLAYLNDAAYPLYVLHMPVVIVVGLVVIQMHMPALATLLLVVLGALGGTLGLYEYVIKRVNVLRLLFGLKPARATSETGG